MKALLLISALFAASFANANIVNMVCTGQTEDGDKVRITGQYENNSDSYYMLSPLVITGTDMQGNALFSSGSGSTGRRVFDADTINLRSKNGFFVLKGEESNGSKITIRHEEGRKGSVYISIDLQPTKTKPEYTHEFNLGLCKF